MSCVHIYYGSGKGKTTAALGLALRSRGAGLRVCVVRFLKDRSSEQIGLEKLGIEERNAGLPGFLKDLPEEKREEAIREQRRLFESLVPKNYDLLVLDEILDLVDLAILSERELEEFVENRGQCELVLTGRSPCQTLAERAHYITEMTARKHPYLTCGQGPRKGIEF